MPPVDYKEMLVITAVTDIALNGSSRAVNAKDLARRHRLPRRHLEPVLPALVHEGILTSVRGPGGGYRHGRDPGQISAQDILRAARSVAAPEHSGGSALLNTVVRPVMAKAERALVDQLSRISIEDLMGTAARTPRIERE